MSSSAFPRFLELPQELQIKIWSFKATPHGRLRLDSDFLLHVGDYYSEYSFPTRDTNHCRFFEFTAPHCIAGSCISFDDSRRAIATAAARLAVLSTCRLSRQVALEEWREDVKGVSKFVYAPESLEFAEQMNVDVLSLLKALIEATKNGEAMTLPKPPPPEQPTRATRSFVEVYDVQAIGSSESRSQRRRRRRRERQEQRNAESSATAT